jgi:hypothetical protein
VDAGIGVNEDAFGGEALRAVTGDGVAVIEMTMLAGAEFDLAVVVEACREAAIGMDHLDRGHVAIRNVERFVGRGELYAVAYRELAFDLPVDADAGEAFDPTELAAWLRKKASVGIRSTSDVRQFERLSGT